MKQIEFKINRDGLITFFGKDRENGFLSNFYPCVFTDYINDKEITFNCVEQYMHFMKATLMGDTTIAIDILTEYNPVMQKKLGRKVRNFDECIWDAYKIEVVTRGVTLKFVQNPELRNKLLLTREAYLAEVNPRDKIWGIGHKDTPIEDWGKNLLGEILMNVRNSIKLNLNDI